MTVIAFRNGVMAADTQATWDETLKTGGEKKIHGARGALIGIAGDTTSGEIFVRWFRAGRPDKRPRIPADKFDALVAFQDGSLAVFDNRLQQIDVSSEFFAVGSGREVALGAMEVGASASQAAAAAIKWSAGCGGKVVTRRLPTPKA